jgi:hypothetical protein
MKKICILCLVLMSMAGTSYAQLATDILNYSQVNYNASARSLGTGNSMSVLGTDFTAAAQNPASLGLYKLSEFSFGMGTNPVNTRAVLLNTDEDVSYKSSVAPFSLNHAHFVATNYDREKYRWRGVSFGIGYNRIANYNREFYYDGISPGSITDRWVNQADGLPSSDLNGFEDGLAFDVAAIYPSNQDETIYLNDFYDGEPVSKNQLVRTRGSMNELSINLAGNYEDKLYIGGALNFPFVNYSETKTYNETDEVTNTNAVFDRLAYEEDLEISGGGFNAKIGFIYRPNFNFRLGASIQTPSSIELDESYTTSLDYTYTFNNNQIQDIAFSPEGFFNYRVRTPWRANFGGALLIKKLGFISATAEYVDYRSARYNFINTNAAADIAYEQELNNTITTEFGSAWNVNIGGEFRIQNFMIRYGVGQQGSPFGRDNIGIRHFNGGFGFFADAIFLNVGAQYSTFSEGYNPYLVAGSFPTSVDLDGNNLIVSMTFGVKMR